MKTKVSSLKVLNVVLCAIMLLIFVLSIWTRNNAEAEAVPLEVITVVAKEFTTYITELDLLVMEKQTTIEFFARIFDYQYDDIIEDIRTRAENSEEFESTNIGSLKDNRGNLKTFLNFEQGLIEYFWELNRTNSSMRNERVVPFEGSASDIKDLINYFATIYPDVCAHTLLSIAAAESGHFRAAHKLRANNIWGAMAGGRILRYNNMELGTLTFVRLMSRNYYGRGLTTLEAIGAVYAPTFENGVREAQPHWLRLVRGVKPRYTNLVNTEITIYDILGIEEY